MGDDSLTGVEALQDGDAPAVFVTELYLAPLKLFAREQYIDDLFAFVLEHCLPGDHHRLDGVAGVEPNVR